MRFLDTTALCKHENDQQIVVPCSVALQSTIVFQFSVIMAQLFLNTLHLFFLRGIVKVTKRKKSRREDRGPEREAALPETTTAVDVLVNIHITVQLLCTFVIKDQLEYLCD